MDFQNLPEGTPVWVTVAGVLIMLFATLSERIAKLKGPLGAAARWWNSRQVREVERKMTLDKRVEELVDQRVESRMSEMSAQLKRLNARVDKLNRSERDQHDYILWVTGILRTIEIWAADHGYELPPPPFQTYSEWLEERARARTPPGND